MKKRVVVLAFAAMAAGLAGMGVWCARLNARVHELEEVKSKSEKVRSKGEEAKREGEKVKSESGNAQEGARETVAATNLPPQLAVLGVDYEGKDQIEVRLSERPDMEVVRRFVSVEPMAEGRPSFEYRAKYDYRANEYVPTLIVRGEFAFRTNCVLKIAKGLPLYGKGANPRAEGSLKEDYIHTFRRKDQTPYVAFAADGRYLPPGGKRAIEVESVNVSNILTSVRRVEPRNVVQMLAREERVYGRYQYSSCADGEETEELAGEKVTNVFRCANRPNVKELTRLTVDVQDGKPTNGIYLVSIFNSDLPKCDWAWRSEILNPVRYRVVCLSDLGLSVRKSGTDGLGVWVTSLTTGQPVAGAWIDVYSPANIKVMEMIKNSREGIHDPEDEDEIRAYLDKILRREVGDRSGLIYGIGHAVYTKSDPRAVLLKEMAHDLAVEKGRQDEYAFMERLERLAIETVYARKGTTKTLCANVDFYSGFVYDLIGLPVDIYTPLFAMARIVGWCAHRNEELNFEGKRIIRPAYRCVADINEYVPIARR